jgi:putative Ca2+/H+ antiporter (TMEM165/GDT1 family)
VAPSATCGCSRGWVRSSIEANDLFISVQWHQFSVQVIQAFLTSAALVGVAESATRRSYFLCSGNAISTPLSHHRGNSVGHPAKPRACWLRRRMACRHGSTPCTQLASEPGVHRLRHVGIAYGRIGQHPATHRTGAFVTTFVAFFLAEMGDKTQFATLALAACFMHGRKWCWVPRSGY